MNVTLVFIRAHIIGGHQYLFAQELPPGVCDKQTADKLIDAGVLREVPERRSLFRLFPDFSKKAGSPE
jgi:hypothetical protein